MYIKFDTIEDYNLQNKVIVDYNNEQSNGSYLKTNTLYEYEPNPTPNEIDGGYYMIVEDKYSHLFEGFELVELPQPIPDDSTE